MNIQNLKNLPELKDFSLITTQEELTDFLGKLRQDWYSLIELGKPQFNLKLPEQFENWIKLCGSDHITFFAFYNEKDDHAKNDGWGHYELFRCIAVKTADSKIHILKSSITKFMH